MRILYIHQYFCTPQAAGGVRSYEFAHRWVSSGHEVHILTSNGYDASLVPGRTQVIDGITVRTLKAAYSPMMGSVARIRAFLLFAIQATWIAVRARDYDVVLATSTPITVALPAAAARFIARRRVVFEVRDVWPDAAIDAGVLRNPLLIRLARGLERLAYRSAHHVVPLSTGMQERIASRKVAPEKMTMLPNCSDLDRFDPARFNRERLRRQRGGEGKFIVLYVGAISLANDIPFLAKCIEATKEDHQIEWWFVGEGNRLAYLKHEVDRQGAKHVIFWGKQLKCMVPEFITSADVGVVSFLNTPTYYDNSPNKFFDYSAGGLPAIFTRTTWLAPYLKKHQAGFVCEKNTPDECVVYIQRFKAQPALREQMGQNARTMAEQEFPRDGIAAKYLTLLENIATNP